MAVYACGPADLLEVVRLRRPVENKVVLDRTAFVEPLVLHGTDERWLVLVSQPARRAAVRRPRRRAGGDRPASSTTSTPSTRSGGWSPSNYQRSVEKEVKDHLANAAELAFDVYKKRGLDRVLIGAPDELLAEFKGKLHPYLRERIAGRIAVDVENASLDDVCGAAKPLIVEHARKCEREALDRLAQGVGTGGRGAAGIAEVLDALNQARVETLLISENFKASGRVDFEAGLLLPDDGRAGRAGRGHRRAGDREGDRAVRDGDGRAPPRRPRPARRHRGGVALLSSRRPRHGDHGRADGAPPRRRGP